MRPSFPERLRFVISFWVVPLAFIASRSNAEVRVESEQRLGRVQIPFVANQGVTNPVVAFYAPTFAGTTSVMRNGKIVYSLRGSSGDATAAPGREIRRQRSPQSLAGWTLTETPVRSLSGAVRVTGEEPSETRVSYFLGNTRAG